MTVPPRADAPDVQPAPPSERDAQIVSLQGWLDTHQHLRSEDSYERVAGRLVALRVNHPSTGGPSTGGDAA